MEQEELMQNSQWRGKVQKVVETCHAEFRRTTEIGKKMLSASKTNTALHESYEELGHLAFRAIKENRLDWGDPRVHDLMDKIKQCEKDLEMFEGEISKIREAEEAEQEKEASSSLKESDHNSDSSN